MERSRFRAMNEYRDVWLSPESMKKADDDRLCKMADRIQARAVRRAQELLNQFPVGKGGDRKSDQSEGTHGLVSRSKAAEGARMSPHQYRTAMDVGLSERQRKTAR